MSKTKPGKIRSTLLNWLGVPIHLTDGEFWREYYGRSNSGKYVTSEKAIRLSTVWACVRLLSESVSTLPLKIYQKMPDESKQLATNHQIYKLLCRRPNAEMTPSRFMLMVIASIALQGNAYVEKIYIGNKLVSLVPLLPQNMTVKRLDNGQLQYKYTEKGTPRIILTDRMMHIRGFGLDGVAGLMPMSTGRDVIGTGIAVEESAGKFFENGLQSAGFITTDKALKKEQRDQIRDNVEKYVGSRNAGKVMVLEGGMGYQGVTINPEAAQMLESRAFSIEEICRWFRVPPFMVGHMTKQNSWASSVEGMNLMFLTNTLRPLLVNIEQEIQRCLLNAVTDADIFAEFSVEGLLRADSAGRAAYYTTALQNGWMSRNDVRRLENMAPIPGGEIYTVQLNLTALEDLRENNATARAQALKELHQHVFPDLDFEHSPLKKKAA